MTKYLYTFPAAAVAGLTPDELRQAGIDSHAEIEAAKAAGVCVFGGGLVLELPDREAAAEWGARFAAACRCEQELHAFMFDPAS